MLEMKIKTGRRSVVPGDRASIMAARRAYRQLGDMVDALIAQMDMLAGDCDIEEDDFGGGDVDDEPHGEEVLLWPIYGPDQSAGPINYDHAVDFLQAIDSFQLCQQSDDLRGARYWKSRVNAVGTFDADRHGATFPGYDS